MRPLLLLCISIASVTGEVAGVAEGEDAERRGKRDLSDVDQMDSSSDTSGTGGSDQDLDHGDPNLTNPQNKMMEVDNVRRQDEQDAKKKRGQRVGPSTTPPPRPTWSQQSTLAIMQFGIIVGVAIMVGSMFMAMVGAEMLYDHLCDKVRAIFKQEKLAPDIERLHPAELVGTFSRYK